MNLHNIQLFQQRRYVRYWNEIESKKKHQKEIIIEEIKTTQTKLEWAVDR